MQKSVVEYLEKTVARLPEKVAVKDAKGELTFAELWEHAQIIATAICATGLRNTPVGVYMPKGCNMVQSFAGISMSGNFYVPLDAKSPNARVESILNVLESEIVITDREHETVLRTFYSKAVLVIEDVLERGEKDERWREAQAKLIDTDPVYSIFTSGSTGTPKGVVIAHRSVIDFIDWLLERFAFTSELVIGNQAPFYFDNSTMDIYLMCATGGTLCVIPEDNFMFPAKLVDYMNANKINFVLWVPFVLINIANMDIFSQKKPEYLKYVIFAGEVLSNKHLNYWRKHLPDCMYANMYGPTEITDICTYYVIDREFAEEEPLPIGIACRNTDLLILVDRKRRAVKGEQGELCVRGSSLALGYYNNPEKTAAAFIQNPLQTHYPETIYCTGDIVYENERGEIMYVGRIDSQIKHNGYRIELGEIENAVLATGQVKNCCLVYDNTNKQIVMHYQADADLNLGAFRRAMGQYVPRYMFPTVYHREEILKQNGSGKIDRAYYNKKVNG